MPSRKLLGLLLLLAGSGPALAQDLSGLHDALRLKPAQEAAWRAYAQAIQPDPEVEGRRRSAAQLAATLTTPRRVDLFEAEMQEDLKDAQRKGEAVKAFYAALDPAQQRTFDQMTAPGARPSPAPSPRR